MRLHRGRFVRVSRSVYCTRMSFFFFVCSFLILRSIYHVACLCCCCLKLSCNNVLPATTAENSPTDFPQNGELDFNDSAFITILVAILRWFSNKKKKTQTICFSTFTEAFFFAFSTTQSLFFYFKTFSSFLYCTSSYYTRL